MSEAEGSQDRAICLHFLPLTVKPSHSSRSRLRSSIRTRFSLIARRPPICLVLVGAPLPLRGLLLDGSCRAPKGTTTPPSAGRMSPTSRRDSRRRSSDYDSSSDDWHGIDNHATASLMLLHNAGQRAGRTVQLSREPAPFGRCRDLRGVQRQIAGVPLLPAMGAVGGRGRRGPVVVPSPGWSLERPVAAPDSSRNGAENGRNSMTQQTYWPGQQGSDKPARQQQGWPQQPVQQPVPSAGWPVTEPKKRHVFLWIFLAVQALFVVWIIAGSASAGGDATNCGTLTQDTCNAAQNAGTGIGVALVVILWMVVDFLMAVIYGVYRLATR